jgi:enediyne polyketide synthase
VKGEGTVDVVIRSGETDFAADHFRATMRFGTELAMSGGPEPSSDGLPTVTLDPARDLYSDILFQGKRFQRLLRYRRVVARHAEADVTTGEVTGWFGMFLPGGLVLGDPGARDALMHGLQVCVPDATLLPVGVERIQLTETVANGEQEWTFVGSERHHDGDLYVYDIAVRDQAGDVVERWEGLRLRAVRQTDGSGPWAPVLLGSVMERRLADLVREQVGAGADVAVAVEPSIGRHRRENTAIALGRALGRVVHVRYRPDGRPILDSGPVVSAAHGAGLTLAAASSGPVGCDVAPVASRTPAEWTDLLGRHAAVRDLLVAETSDSPDIAATRVWCAAECLQKAGEVSPHAPLTLLPRVRDGWSVLASGDLRIATFVTTLRDEANPVVFAVLTKEGR